MDSHVNHDIPVTGWQAEWIARTMPALWYYTVGLTYVLSGILMFTNVRTLVRQRRTHRALTADPSSRASILAAHEKRMAASSRVNFYVTLLFILHAVAIYCVDVYISVSALGRDYADHGFDGQGHGLWSSSPSFLLAFAGMLAAVFLTVGAVFVVVPLVQVALVSWWIARRFPPGGGRSNGGPRTSLADYVPEARIVATTMAQMWALLEFFIVAWWPVDTHSPVRIMCYLATSGSALAWMDASFAFNFCAANLEEVDLKGLSGMSGVGEIIRKFGRHVVAVHSFKKGVEQPLLPKHEVPLVPEDYSEKEAV